jgi:PhnB protein
MRLFTQLNFGGNCAEAFRHYEQNLNGKILAMVRQSETPAPKQSAPNDRDPVVHARMTLGETVLIANDVPPDVFKPIRVFISTWQWIVWTRLSVCTGY